VNDDVHAIPVQQVDDLADNSDGQISQPVTELVGLEPSTHEVGALKPKVDNTARTFVAVATPIELGAGSNNGDVSPERDLPLPGGPKKLETSLRAMTFLMIQSLHHG